MRIREPRLRALLTQAERNASYGKLAAAESMYRQILAEVPDSEEAWVGLGEVAVTPEVKRSAFERALELDPGNARAEAGLARLDGRYVPEPVEAVAVVDNGAAVQTVEPSEISGAALPAPEEETYELVCYRHPERATSLRCYNCSRPICISCARKTPVGYICPECQRQAEDAFFNSRPLDYLIAALVSFPISLLAGYLIVNFFSRGFLFFIIIFFISGAVGSFIARVTKRAIGQRRGRYLPQLVVAMMIIGVLIPALPIFLAVVFGNVGALLALLGPGIYLFVASGAAYWQMR